MAPPADTAKRLLFTLSDGTEVRSTYVPSERQLQYHRSRKRYVLFGGARGGGKTRAEVEDIIDLAIAYPGIPIGVARRDLKDLKRTVLKEFLIQCPKQYYDPEFGGQFNRSENWIRFYNGSEIFFTEMKDVDSWRSATMGRWYYDEVHEDSDIERTVRELNATLRWTTGVGTCERQECYDAAIEFDLEYETHATHPIRQVKMCCNPHGGYLKEQFYTPWKAGREKAHHEYIPALVFDNPGADVSYRAALMDNPPAWVENFVMGNWEAFENQAFPNFNRATHIFRGPIPYAQFVRVEGGVDYGSTGTAAHRSAMYLTARLRNGTYLTFYEWSEVGAPSDEMFGEMARATVDFRVKKWHADASQFMANDIIKKQGAIPIEAAPRYQGAVKDGVNLLNRLMMVNATGRPGMQVHESCERLIVGFESYSVDPKTGLYIKKNDDEIDAVRYDYMGLVGTEGANNKAREPQEIQVKHAEPNKRRNRIIEARHAEKRARLARHLKTGDY